MDEKTAAEEADNGQRPEEEQAAQEPAESAASETPKPETDWKAEARKWEARAKRGSSEEASAAVERAEKAEAELAALKAERERDRAVAEAAKEAGVPADVLRLMRGDTADELKEAAEALAGYVKSLNIYPEVPDGGAKQAPPVTKEEISGIKDRAARVRARAENAALYR